MKHLGGDGSPLHLPLASLDLSREFTATASAHGYKMLDDFQQLTIDDLFQLHWFTADMFRELTAILKKLHELVSA